MRTRGETSSSDRGCSRKVEEALTNLVAQMSGTQADLDQFKQQIKASLVDFMERIEYDDDRSAPPRQRMATPSAGMTV